MHDPMAAPEPVSSTARAFLRPADHDRRNDQSEWRRPAGVPGARELAAWHRSPAHGFTWNHVRRIAPTKWCPSRATKVPAGVAIETTVANCSRPSEPSTAVSCAVYAVQPLPPGGWPSQRPPGRLASRVARPGAASPMTLSNAALDAHGECRQRPCRRPQRPFQAAALCMWSYSVLV